MKRGWRLFAAGVFAALLLTGCSNFSPEMSGISIGKKGTVTEVSIENFDKDYYDKSELESEITASIEAYNSTAGSKAVKKNSFSVKDGVAKLRITYASASDYAEFNNVDLYVGDIQGAVQAGYAFEGQFYEVSDGTAKEDTAIWGSQIMTGTNYNTVAVREALLIEVPGTIRYVSANVQVKDSSTAVIAENETAYILYE